MRDVQLAAMALQHPALDLLWTGGLTRIRRYCERFDSPKGLADWLAEAVLDGEVVAGDHEVETARELREAVFNIVRARTAGSEIDLVWFDTLNRLAAEPPLTPRVEPTTARRRWAAPVTAAAALSTIARDAISLFTGPEAHRVRECANPECELVFVDTSPPGQRRWCAMRRCGNIAKTRAYRRRSGPAAATKG
jgi:predicted RNA-binding Zn ribbon-like protein